MRWGRSQIVRQAAGGRNFIVVPALSLKRIVVPAFSFKRRSQQEMRKPDGEMKKSSAQPASASFGSTPITSPLSPLVLHHSPLTAAPCQSW